VSDEEPILRRLDNGVQWITLNRPEAGNAVISPHMRDQLRDWFHEAADATEVRAVVLTGAGDRAFCNGADLRTRGAPPPRPADAPERIVGDGARTIRTGWGALISAVQDCDKPVIAAVNGSAAGGGMHLALACDLVIMAEAARFISVFVRRGILPDAGGAYLLTRLVGPQRAKQVFFFGDDVSAAEAERLGLVNKVVPLAELEKTAREWAERLAAAPTRAIGFTKLLVNRALESDRATSIAEESAYQELLSGTADAREGVASFVERRAPEFKGW